MAETMLLLYVPCPSQNVALGLAHELLEKKLIFCANVLPAAISCYRWEGVVQQESEAILIAKTFEKYHKEAAEALQLAHPNQTPAVLSLPMVAESADFFAWALQEMRTP